MGDSTLEKCTVFLVEQYEEITKRYGLLKNYCILQVI